MNFTHRADSAIPDPFTNQAGTFFGVALVTHLRDHIPFLGFKSEEASFLYCVCQRFLDKHVLAHFDGHHSNNGMGVVGGADRDGIN